MKLAEALRVIHQAQRSESPPCQVYLACGFEPLHLLTFLNAHCSLARPDRHVTLRRGSYANLTGNLESPAARESENVAMVLEWPDLDPRLGLRMPALWNADTMREISVESARRLARLEHALEGLRHQSVIACAPTLPFPPAALVAPWLASELELDLEYQLSSFRQRTRGLGVKWLSTGALGAVSPGTSRYDCKGDFSSGFPYSMTHADELAGLLSSLLFAPPLRKGVITDLDGTLWKGIVGEVGPENVSWDLDHNSRPHGLYQQILRSLAESGILVGIASKNDPAVVTEAFQRRDLLLRAEHVFPMEVHWGPKSESVARIAKAWNIGLDSIVFVDDSALERDEVARAHPQVECLAFPADPGGVEALCRRLRGLFGRDKVTEEDQLRLSTIRLNQEWQAVTDAGEADEAFLAGLNARLLLDCRRHNPDPRALELINKTNQFNLNGVRRDEGEWRRFLAQDNAFCWIVSYEDRLGPLGRIAVLAGTREGKHITLAHWVMSCRAFSRRIEHACLSWLFHEVAGKPGATSVTLQFSATPRNGPTRDFLRLWGDGADGQEAAEITLTRAAFEQHCQPLHHHFDDQPLTDGASQRSEFASQEISS